MPDMMNYLKIMERNTNRLIDLTNQLLDFKQTEISSFSLSFIRADIAAILVETYHNFKPLAEQNKLQFHLSIPADAVYAYIDFDAFSKILYNLFGNAVKYAETTIVIELQPMVASSKYFTITTKNDGFIIPNNMKEKIYQPFFRLKETEKQKGTGIGLALSRSLAQLHTGTLVLGEPEANMNVFVLTLPLHQDNEFNLSQPLI